jgi:menaquinone-specific isochorismate synthase
MQARTVRLDPDLDPLRLGARTGLLWTRHSAGDPVSALAGVGKALRLPVVRPDGADEAQVALAALTGPNEVGGPATGPVAFGAFPFDPQAPGELVVPELVVGRGADGRRWLTIVDDGALTPGDAIDRVFDELATSSVVGPAPSSDPDPTTFELGSVVRPETWRDEIVAAARDRIRTGELDKVVLARELRLRTDQPLDGAAVIEQLAATFPTSIVFAVDGFIGASPELLVGRHGDVVRAHPLAGTAPRATDPADDRRRAADLLASTKDRWEHRITIDWLLDGLLPFCSYVDAEPEPSIVSLANVHHLGTLVEGRLSSPPASALELVAALHPTPAVGGAPQDRALALIAELERADRGRYAGPVGWVDAEGNGSFAVGIRSALLVGTEVRLFAGVGVVADSDPVAELAETRAKFRAMLGALIRP